MEGGTHPPQLPALVVLSLGLQPPHGALDGGVPVGGVARLHPRL